MRVTLLHNPGAGYFEVSPDALAAEFRAVGFESECFELEPESLNEVLRRAGDVVAVSGGDGAIASVMKGLAGTRTPLLVLPSGTANNIAQTCGMAGRTPAEIISGMRQMRPVAFDVGRMRAGEESRRFVESVGFGFFAHALATLKGSSEARDESFDDAEEEMARDVRYLRRVLAACTGERLAITLDGRRMDGHFVLAEVMNIGMVGPNLRLAPDADTGDGLLDVVLVRFDERQRIDDYLRNRLADAGAPAHLPVFKASRVEISAGDAPVHIDDEPWRAPQPGQGGEEAPDRIEIGMERAAVHVLA
jgi:diacylglycerol kinase (ATP)